jgi:hypothetical protein
MNGAQRFAFHTLQKPGAVQGDVMRSELIAPSKSFVGMTIGALAT